MLKWAICEREPIFCFVISVISFRFEYSVIQPIFTYPDMEKNMKKDLKKVFKGKTQFVLDYSTIETLEASKQDRHFHQRMLRAYLKGKEVFNFGFTKSLDGMLTPIEHKVLFAWE